MSFFSTLRSRSLPFLAQRRSSIQRFQIRHSSTTSSLPNASNPVRTGFGLKCVSTVLAGTSLGFLLFGFRSPSPTSEFDSALLKSSISSLLHRSLQDPNRRRSVFPKFSLPENAFRRKIFFNYEKRIRLRSPPEKVFEYFASDRSPQGEVLMKPADLMRAVVPVFPPSESHLVRDGYLEGERRPGHLRCPPSEFFMLFDVNNDGLISFKEYIFFVTLLGIPESSFSVAFKMFDVDNSGEISKEEFKKVMALMRSCHRQGVHHRDGLRTGLKVNNSVEDGGLVEYFFDKDGNGRLQLDKFVKFLRDLHDEFWLEGWWCAVTSDIMLTAIGSMQTSFEPIILWNYLRWGDSSRGSGMLSFSSILVLEREKVWSIKPQNEFRLCNGLAECMSLHSILSPLFFFLGYSCGIRILLHINQSPLTILRLEFAHYDYKGRQTISAKDFALSMVASADMSNLGRLLGLVDGLDDDPRLKDARITFDEFKNFAELRKKLLPFSLALFSFGEVNGLLTRDDFQRAASHVCGISLSDNVVEIVFHLFDTNRDGNLSFDEFVRVLHKREMDIAQPVETGIMGLLSSCWNSSKDFSSSWLFS
ncbi:hypothetical protein Fmac_031931 [Flemingia macrophylla]|uniref:EF-hand domain-containing protein n=1 Tax=Flemingia macrophylla TaxID=520843 RepID=A0ABD1L3H4_9FABA